MKIISSAIFLIAVLFLTNLSVRAQETELKVVDEVIAQVNDGVITLSRVKREMNDVIKTSVIEGKTREQAEAEVQSKEGELIASIINEELLLQKGKELGVETEVEALINQRLGEIMKQQNIKTLDALYKEMEAGGVDPQELREVWRKQFTRDAVLQREVDSKVYYGWTAKEIKSYFDAHKAEFTKPETITLSEIFLGFAGRTDSEVKEKAQKLVAQLRAGADFAKLAVENSDHSDVAKTKGSAGTVNVKELDAKFAKPLENVKVGGISDPIEVVEGIEIFRVDGRTKASNESFFDENDVRRAMTVEKIPDQRRKYLATLRDESYVKINEKYRPMVAPLLNTETKAENKKSEK